VTPLVGDRLTRPEPPAGFDRFVKAAATLCQRHPARFILDRVLAAHADTENKTPAGELIDGRRLLGNDRRRIRVEMTMKRRSFLLSGAGALGAAAIPHSARAQLVPRQYQQMLNIGVNVPLSGDRAQAGREIAGGIQAAIDYANRYGGTFGSAFAMRTFDDMDALAQSMVNVQFAAADPTIIAMVAAFDGPLISAVLTTYESTQMPLLVPGTTPDRATARGFRNVWRLPTQSSTARLLASQFVAKCE